MKARVYLLRRNGRRVRETDECFLGTLMVDATMQGGTLYAAAHLRETALRGSREDDLLPPLFEPVLAAIGNGVLLLRGYESKDGAGFVQEWRCVLEQSGGVR